MSGTVVIALPYFAREAERIAETIGGEFRPYHEDVFTDAFATADRIIALMAVGIVVRKIGPLLADKWRDPAVVVISPDLTFAIPITGGHHGANDLAGELRDRLGLIPVITTGHFPEKEQISLIIGTAVGAGFTYLLKQVRTDSNGTIY